MNARIVCIVHVREAIAGLIGLARLAGLLALSASR